MAIGKCVNISKPCSKAIHREEIEADKANFVCPECGKPLVEIKGKKTPDKHGPDAPPPINWKLIGIIAAVVAVIGGCIGAFFAFGGSGGLKDSDRIKLSEKNLTLVIGENPKALLKATVIDKDSNEVKDANVKFTWSIKDEKVATVTQGGEVTAIKKGKTTITVKIEGDKKEGRRATCKVEVKEPDGGKGGKSEKEYVEKIMPSESSLTMKVGETKSIGYTCIPEKHDEQIFIDVTDKSVASFSADGTLKALKAGTTIITITADQSGTQATVEVTVNKQVEESSAVKSENKDKKQKPLESTGGLRLSYGTYTGKIVGGYPNGQGRLVYSRTRQISRYDNKARMAQPGESVQGTFKNGFFVIGKHYDSSGNLIESLNLGSPVDGIYESK